MPNKRKQRLRNKRMPYRNTEDRRTRSQVYYQAKKQRILDYNRKRQQRIRALIYCIRCQVRPPRSRCETCWDCAAACCDCGARLPLTGKATGKGARCAECSARNKSYQFKRRHAERVNRQVCTTCASRVPEAGRKKCSTCLADGRRYNYEKYRRLRSEVFAHYGTACACCGESEEEFLTLDHIANDGALERKVQGNSSLYWRVRKAFNATGTWPIGLQTLCYNCNCSKGKLGVCAHEFRCLRLVNE